MNTQTLGVFLTKEAMAHHIEALKKEKAKEFGLTLEEYNNAIMSGSVLTPINDKDTKRMW